MLRFKAKISRRAAHDMIMLFAKHGNHFHSRHFRSDADVKRALARNGIDYEKLVMRCRDCHEAVPFFENLVGSTASSVGGASLARVNNETGAADLDTNGPGILVLYSYWAAFEVAVEARNRAVSKSSYTEFHTAIVHGTASIEGYVQSKTELWNKQHPENALLDSTENKVRLDDKITQWIPVVTAGRKLDRGSVEWNDFRTLRQIRDDLAIHPKSASYSISFSKLAEQVNLFRTGIARLLIKLHLLFDDPIPAIVIRAAYAPDIEVVPDIPERQEPPNNVV